MKKNKKKKPPAAPGKQVRYMHKDGRIAEWDDPDAEVSGTPNGIRQDTDNSGAEAKAGNTLREKTGGNNGKSTDPEP